jgi:hypothetical protein
MKIKSIIASIILLLFIIPSVFAQQEENQLFFAIKHKVKPEQVDEYLMVWKELATACKEHNYQYSYSVWQSTFPDFYFFFPVKDYNAVSEITSEIWKVIPKMGSGYGKKLMTTLESWDQFFIRSIDALGYDPENSIEGLVYAEWWIHYYNSWTGSNYREAFKQANDIQKKANFEYPYYVFQADIGMNGPAIITVFWGTSPSDLYNHTDKAWQNLGEEGQKIIQDLNSTTRKFEKITFWSLKDLSYSPE